MDASLVEKFSYFAKQFFLNLNLEDEDYLYVKFLFHNLTIYRKCFLFQLLSCWILMRILVLTRVQNGLMTS